MFTGRFILLFILLLATTIRLAYFFLVFSYSTFPTNDSLEHHLIARNLVEGKGYQLYGQSTAFRAPLLTFMVAGVYGLFGNNYVIARLMVILFSILLVWAVYELGRTVVDQRVGLWSALIAALWIHFVLYGSRIFTEIPYTLFSVLAVVLVMKYLQNSKLFWLILSAMFLALAILTRPVGIFLLIMILLVLLIRKWDWKNRLRTLILAGLTLLLLTPWIWRNYQVFHRIIPVTTAGGLVLWLSNNHYVAHHPENWGRYVGYEQLPGAEKLIPQDEIARNTYSVKYTREFLENYPADIPRLLWNKTRRFWSPDISTISPRAWIIRYSYIILLLLAIPAMIRAYRREIPNRQWLWIIIFANFLPALIYWSGSRVRLPAEPALIVFAGIMLNGIWSTLWKKAR